MHAEELPRESGESGAMDRREIDIDIDMMRWEYPGGLERMNAAAARPCPALARPFSSAKRANRQTETYLPYF